MKTFCVAGMVNVYRVGKSSWDSVSNCVKKTCRKGLKS